MNHWYEDDYEYEPEPEINLPESQSVTVGLSINAGQIEAAIDKHLREILEPRIKKMVNDKINAHMDTLLKNDRWSGNHFKSMLAEAIEKRMEKRYPEVCENKANEFYEALLATKYADSRGDTAKTFHTKAKEKVDAYIENELVDSVKRSKDYIEQFSKNYFANNLFKAMGMMDKMLPQTKSSLEAGNN